MKTNAILGALLLLFLLIPAASAGTQGSCPPTDTTRAMVWENAIGDTGDGNDVLWLCSSNANLSNVSHTLPGNCNDGGIGGATWNDCISSVTTYLPSGWKLCLYLNAGYSSLGRTITGPTHGERVNVAYDAYSSLKFTSGAC